MQPGSVVHWRTTEGLTQATALLPCLCLLLCSGFDYYCFRCDTWYLLPGFQSCLLHLEFKHFKILICFYRLHFRDLHVHCLHSTNYMVWLDINILKAWYFFYYLHYWDLHVHCLYSTNHMVGYQHFKSLIFFLSSSLPRFTCSLSILYVLSGIVGYLLTHYCHLSPSVGVSLFYRVQCSMSWS